MKELKVSELTKTYGEKTLFDQLSFLIHEKDRIGLIGVNGTGKSSLLRILAGLDRGDGDRQTVFAAQDYRIGFLTQDNQLQEELSVVDAVFQGTSPLIRVVRDYEKALIALENNGLDQQTQRNYQLAEEAMNKADAWNTDTTAKIILQKLGINELEKKVSELSGGQKKRVAMAQVLIDEPDLLLLDEPTNHLDYDAIQWLEGYLKNYRGALLMGTHDRYFLDRVVNRILNCLLASYMNIRAITRHIFMLEQKENVWRRRKKTSASSCTNMSWLGFALELRPVQRNNRPGSIVSMI